MDGQQSDRSIPDVAYMDSYLLFFWAGRQFPPGVALASVALGSTPSWARTIWFFLYNSREVDFSVLRLPYSAPLAQ